MRTTVKGVAAPLPDDMRVRWRAAAPPDRRTSFSGSALPFASVSQAFHAPQSGGAAVGPGGSYEIELEVPNSYHVRSSEHPVPPQLVVEWVSSGRPHSRTVSLATGTEPARSLRPACTDAELALDDVMTQEAYLYLRKYEPPSGPLSFIP